MSCRSSESVALQRRLRSRYGPVYIFCRSSPARYGYPHAAFTSPRCSRKECLASGVDRRHHLVRPAIVVFFGGIGSMIVEADEPLVDVRQANHSCVGEGADPADDIVRMPATACDQVAKTGAAELPKCGVGRETAGSTGVVGCPVELVSHVSGMHQVARMMLHRRSV